MYLLVHICTSSSWKTNKENSIMRPRTINLSLCNTMWCVLTVQRLRSYIQAASKRTYTVYTVKIVIIRSIWEFQRSFIRTGPCITILLVLGKSCFFRMYFSKNMSCIFSLCWFLYKYVFENLMLMKLMHVKFVYCKYLMYILWTFFLAVSFRDINYHKKWNQWQN